MYHLTPYLPWSLYPEACAFSALHLNETDRFHRARTHEEERTSVVSARVACIALREIKKRKEIHTGDEEVIYADISYTRDVWGFAASLCHCQIPARCSSRHNRDDPYFPAAMRQASPWCDSPFRTFIFHSARDLSRAQIHLPCRRERLPFLHPPSLRATLLHLPSLLHGTRPAGVATIVHRFRWNSPSR